MVADEYKYQIQSSATSWRWPEETRGQREFDYNEITGGVALVIEAYQLSTGEHVATGIFLKNSLRRVYTPDLIYVRRDHVRRGIGSHIWKLAHEKIEAEFRIELDDRLTNEGKIFVNAMYDRE